MLAALHQVLARAEAAHFSRGILRATVPASTRVESVLFVVVVVGRTLIH